VTVYDFHSCDPNFPQVFCSIFDSLTARTCDAKLGSPLIAADSSFAGFVIDDSEKCEIISDKFALNYVSIGEHKDWIEEVSGAERHGKIWLMTLVTSIAFKVFY
jgi:hypothetical protein